MAIVVNPQGVVGEVPDGQLPDAVQQGYAPASPEQSKAFLEKREFTSGAANQVKAFAEGAGSAASFGGTDVVERALGVDPRALELRSQLPAHTVGSGVGIIAPAFFGDEAGIAGALAKGAKGVGEAVGGGTLGALARGAVEGAGYGAGSAASEAARGENPNVVEDIGAGALSGGALVGAGSLAGDALKSLAPTIGPKAAKWLEGFEATRNIKAAGGIQQDIRKAEEKIGKEGLRKLALEAPDAGLFGHGLIDQLTTDPGKVYDRANDLMKSAGSEMGSILDHADANVAEAKMPQIRDVTNRVRAEVVRPLADNPLEVTTANRLAGILNAYDARFAEGADFSDLHEMRKEVSQKLYGLRGTQDPEGTAFKSALHDFRTIISDQLNKSLDAAGLDSDAWKAANRKYQIAATFGRFADRGLQRQAGNNLIPPTTILGGIAGLLHGTGAGLGGAAFAYGAKRYGSAVLGTAARALRGGVGEALLARAGAAAPAAEAALGDTTALGEHVAPLAVQGILSGEEDSPGVLTQLAKKSAPKIMDALDQINAMRYGPEDAKLLRTIGASPFMSPERLMGHAQDAARRASNDLSGTLVQSGTRSVASLKDVLAAIQGAVPKEDLADELRMTLVDYAQQQALRSDIGKDVGARWANVAKVVNEGKGASAPLSFAETFALGQRLSSVPGGPAARDAVESLLTERLTGEPAKAWGKYIAARDEAQHIADLATKAIRMQAPRVRSPLMATGVLADIRGGPLHAVARGALDQLANVEGEAGRRIGARDAMAAAFAKHLPGFDAEATPGAWAETQAAATQDARDIAPDTSIPPSVAPEQAPTHESAAALVALKAYQDEARARMESAADAVVTGRVPDALKMDAPPSTEKIVESMKRVRELTGDVERLGGSMTQQTAGLSEHAPATAATMSGIMARALMYLASNLPPVRQPSVSEPDPGEPSRAAAISFWQIQQALQHPDEVLANNPTDAQLQAIATVYPARGPAMSDELMKALKKDGRTPKFQDVVRVQRITGLPLAGQRLAPVPMKPPAPPKSSPAPKRQGAAAGKLAKTERLPWNAPFGGP